MNQYNFPTIILSGPGALEEFVIRLKTENHQRVFVVTDDTLKSCGILDQLTAVLKKEKLRFPCLQAFTPIPLKKM